MPNDERVDPNERPTSEQRPGQDASAEPPDGGPRQAGTTIQASQKVAQMTGGRATAVEIHKLEGTVIIQTTGAEPVPVAEDLRQPSLPTSRFEPVTILIPRGPFLMGSVPGPDVSEHETPQHEVDLPDFRIARYPVTCDQYGAFVQDCTGRDTPPGWFNREPPPARLDHPVTDVSWHDAIAYCAWLSEQTGRCYTLPSEAEWEKAASWMESEEPEAQRARKRRYPWGAEWLAGRCNTNKRGTTATTAHPDGASAYGVEDLLGNVQEWTRSLWGHQPGQPDFKYPYDPADGREIADPARLPSQARLVHRGGSFRSAPDQLRCTARGNSLSHGKTAWRGFRVVLRIG
jgi:formylglycine-generating enzyme required for sulfatase activity